MADFQVTGFVNTIKYLENTCIIYVDEFKKGYKKHNGEIIEDKMLTWRCLCKPNSREYISRHFNNGMLVTIKGELLPYALAHEKMIDGYTVLTQTINMASYPRSFAKKEARMIKESQVHASGTPDLEDYITPDF